MPVPIRDDGTPGPTRKLAVFVHGFNSTAEGCWGEMLRCLRKDSSLLEQYEFDTFEYDTTLIKASFLKRIPSLDELGAELGGYLERKMIDSRTGVTRYIDTTLIGHSMGGLVIQSYLTKRLACGHGSDFDRLRQLIFFATPHHGSDLLVVARRALFALIPNPQEQSLRSLNEELKLLHRDIRERVIDARSRGKYKYPLPAYCFWGASDNIVPEWSGRGHFPLGEPLPGDHISINKPSIPRCQSHGKTEGPFAAYDALVDLLLHPYGHMHVWEVEWFSFRVQVTPLPNNTVIQARHGDKERYVETDNSAVVIREIRFARHNQCSDPFTLRYATRSDGWIEALMPEHITSPEKLRQYDDGGTEVTAEIEPDPERFSRLSMKVYKGFDKGHRDYHMHLGKRSYFRELEFEVDLSHYLKAGWVITHPPQLYFHPDDPGDHRLCANRQMLDPDPPYHRDPCGIWRWKLEHVKEGVIDIAWDVSPMTQIVVSETPSLIELLPGEHAIFGYGSLLSLASLERTLGRRYTGPFAVCDLPGWRRAWNVAMPNSIFEYQEKSAWITPERILYLNLVRGSAPPVNGVVFVIREDDLRAFDEREWIYERVSVTEQLRGVTIKGGSAWAFIGKREFCIAPSHNPRLAAIRKSYMNIVEEGIRGLGSDFSTSYQESTDIMPAHLIVQDRKRDSTLPGAI